MEERFFRETEAKLSVRSEISRYLFTGQSYAESSLDEPFTIATVLSATLVLLTDFFLHTGKAAGVAVYSLVIHEGPITCY